MWIHINNKLSSVCACYTLKEDNFVVLQVVCETKNSKLIVILKSRGQDIQEQI